MQTLILQAYMLLVMASGLLTQVQNSPNVSPELKKTAEITATNAISFAQTVIAGQTAKSVPESTVIPTSRIAPEELQKTCTESPSLILFPSTSSGRYVISGTYTTGCEIDPNTKWSYHRDGDEDSGTTGMLYNTPYAFARTQNNTWTFQYFVAKEGQTFTLTVGSTTSSL